MKLYKKITSSRYRWFLQGLPDISRAQTLLAIRYHTMTSVTRSKLLWDFCKKILKSDVPGDFVECGVWKGGSAGIMGMALEKFDGDHRRKLHLFDSFEGLPEPGELDGERAAIYSGGLSSGKLESVHQCEAGIDEVKNFLIKNLSLAEKRLVFHKGWFQDTLPLLEGHPAQIALLRLDGDWYESTKVCLDYLYDRVPKGGVIILDDYFCWEGCKKAADEFRSARGIVDEIVRIDHEAVYWIKS